ERGGLFPREVIEAGHPQATDLPHVAKALGGEQPGPGALQLEDGVRADRGSVQDLGGVGAAGPPPAKHLPHGIDDGARVVVDAGGDLLGVNPALGVEEDDVGERTTDVDTNPESGATHRTHRVFPRPATGQTISRRPSRTPYSSSWRKTVASE